jgi:hypothetical protein
MKFVFSTILLFVGHIALASTLAMTDGKSSPLPAASPAPAPQGRSLCSGLCGWLSETGYPTQGANLIQMMATGATPAEAFAKVQKLCQDLADKNPDVSPIRLYIGFQISTEPGCIKGCSLIGAGYPASQGNSCVAL